MGKYTRCLHFHRVTIKGKLYLLSFCLLIPGETNYLHTFNVSKQPHNSFNITTAEATFKNSFRSGFFLLYIRENTWTIKATLLGIPQKPCGRSDRRRRMARNRCTAPRVALRPKTDRGRERSQRAEKYSGWRARRYQR